MRYSVGCLKGKVQPGTLRGHGGCTWSRRVFACAKAPYYTGQWGRKERDALNLTSQGCRAIGQWCCLRSAGSLVMPITRRYRAEQTLEGSGVRGQRSGLLGASQRRPVIPPPVPFFAAARWPSPSILTTTDRGGERGKRTQGGTALRTPAHLARHQQGYGAGEERSAGTAPEAAAGAALRALWGGGPVTLSTNVEEKGGARRPSLSKMRRRAVWSSQGGERRCPPGCGSLIGKSCSYCSAKARDTSVGGSGRARSLKGRPGHQRCARSPVLRPTSSRLA